MAENQQQSAGQRKLSKPKLRAAGPYEDSFLYGEARKVFIKALDAIGASSLAAAFFLFFTTYKTLANVLLLIGLSSFLWAVFLTWLPPLRKARKSKRRRIYGSFITLQSLIIIMCVGLQIIMVKDSNEFWGNAPENENDSSTKRNGMTGQVRDEKGGLPDVDILDINSGTRTNSDRTGMFTLEVKERSKGWVRIQASKKGYETWEDYVETKPGLIILLRREQK